MSTSKNNETIARLIFALVAITLVSAVVLGFINQITAPKIQENNEKTIAAAMSEIIPNANFEEVDVSEEAEGSIVKSAYKATVDGTDAGYCVQVTPSGFGGDLTVIVGISSDGSIAGAKVTSHTETPGLGAKSQDAEWIGQFVGQAADGSVAVAKDGGTIVSISGATITSRAVSNGVNAAANFVASIK